MRVTPIASPSAIVQPQAAPSSRDTAIAKLAASMNPTPVAPVAPKAPVADPNHVDPLEHIQIQADASVAEPEQAAAVEEVPTQQKEVEPTAEELNLRRQFQQLARQEKAIRAKAQQQEQVLKQREAALAEREAKLTQQDQSYKSDYISIKDLTRNPLAVLDKAGITYDQLTNELLNPAPTNPRYEATINELQAKLDAMEAKLETGSKSQVEAQQQQYQAAVEQITTDVKALVKGDPNAYEAIAKTGSVKDVVDLIEQTYAKDGILLSVEEAAQEVENYLIEESYASFNKIEKLKKRIAQSSASPEKSEVKTQAPQTKPQASITTLTNTMGAPRQLTARERALLAFRGELK